MLQEAFEFVKRVLVSVIVWFDATLEATETTDLWIAAVIFAVCMSVIVLPLRGGKAVGNDSFAGFLSNKIYSGRETVRRERDKTDREARWRFWRRGQ